METVPPSAGMLISVLGMVSGFTDRTEKDGSEIAMKYPRLLFMVIICEVSNEKVRSSEGVSM